MGDAAVSALVKEITGRLTSVAIQGIAPLKGLQSDISSLKGDFEQIQAVLQDAEEKQIMNEAEEYWIKRLRSVSMKVENLLDEISTEALLQRLHKQRGIKYRVRHFFSTNYNQYAIRVRIAHKVRAIRRKLHNVLVERSKLRLATGTLSPVNVGVEGEMLDWETGWLIHDSSIIFGRDEDIELVTETICNKDIGKHENGEIRVYGIWGMGGVGKTTLAQLVYSHERVNQYFDFKCWIYVSQNFQVKAIIKKIIEFRDHDGCSHIQLDYLQESLQSKLRGRKFLIVLDGVWIEDDKKAKWDELSKTLSSGAEGSIVMMTTRSRATSEMMAKVPELQHKLGCLSEEDSWLLFKKLAFAPGREGDDISELEPIGREIVEKCNGLPLAVKTLGRLMWSISSTSDWQRVKGSNIWDLDKVKHLLAILKLSYDKLLPHIKRCFAYCCLFPKGYAMQKDVLIQLWASNHFIPPIEDISVYVLGERIFNELVWKSFFEVVKENKYSDDRYKMNDWMHDMVRHVFRGDYLVIEPVSKEVIISNEVFHLSSSSPGFLFSPQELAMLKSLRSIFMFGKMNEGSISQIFNHTYVRVLYLCGILSKTLPESIRNLKYLKYLNLSESKIEVLPESVVYLQNLQVLLLYSCRELQKLPDNLRYMSSLEWLDISYCHSLPHLPFGIKQLTRLRILPEFPVGNETGAKIGELGDLDLLMGKLKISGLENVGGLSEARNAKLECKENLSVLGLRWSDIYKRESKPEMLANDEQVLEGLEPNSCLEELKVFCYMGKVFSPSWMAKLHNLVEIRFYSCKRCDHIPQLGRLPKLRVIWLWSMDSLKGFHDDDKNMLEDTNMFLCLQELRIYLCPNLVSLPSNLPNLEVLRLVKCDKLPSLPDKIQSFKNMNNLVILGCKLLNKRLEEKNCEDWAKISHIPNIRTRSPWYKQDEDEDEDEDESGW